MSEKKMKAHKINSCTLPTAAAARGEFCGRADSTNIEKGNKNVSPPLLLLQHYTQNGANAHVISLPETHVLFAVF